MSEDNVKSAVAKALLKKSNAIKSSAELLSTRVNDWQVIRKYIQNRMNDIQLTPMQQEKLTRYKFVYEQLSTGKVLEKEMAAMLKRQFDLNDSQAYEDIRYAKEVYSEVFDINKAWELKLMLDMNQVMLQKAKEANDLKAYAALEKNRAKLLELVQDKEQNPAEDFKGHVNVIMFDPALIGAEPVDMKEVEEYIETRRKKLRTEKIQEAEVLDDQPKQDTL